MKKLTRIITTASLIIALVLPTAAFAANLSVSSTSSDIMIGDTFSSIIRLDTNVSAQTGAVSVKIPDGIKLTKAEWLVPDTMLQNFDMNTNLGAFAFKTKTDFSGDLLKLDFKATSTGDKSISVNFFAKDGNTKVFDETIAINVGVYSETRTTAQSKAQETSIAYLPDGATVIYIIENSDESEESSIDSEGSNEASNEEAQSDENLNNINSTKYVILYIIIGVLVAAAIAVAIVFIKKKKKTKEKTKEKTEDKHD